MSGLTKKVIYVDKTLSIILGVSEGSLASYSELLKGLHRYIKEKDLKNPNAQTRMTPVPSSVPVTADRCKSCGQKLPPGAAFCDMCGVQQ